MSADDSIFLLEEKYKTAVWYLLSESDYSGPFHQNEILRLIALGSVSNSDKIWSEQLEDWMPIEKHPTFNDALKSKRNTEKPSKKELLSWDTSDKFWETITDPEAFQSEEFDFIHKKKQTPVKKVSRSIYKASDNTTTTKTARFRLAIITGIIFSTVSFIVLQIAFSPNTKRSVELLNLSYKDSLTLIAAIGDPVAKVGPNVALARLEGNLSEPQFVIGTNQPDGTRFKLLIEGVSDTLIRERTVSLQAVLIVKDGISVSPILRLIDGQPVPRGDYTVVAQCDSCRQGNESRGNAPARAMETFFLGGPKDSAYDLELRKFHDKVRTNARDEIVQFRQLSDTLENQLKGLVSLAEELEMEKASFDTEKAKLTLKDWTKLEDQLNLFVSSWLTKNQSGDVFYIEVLQLLEKSQQEVAESAKITSAYLRGISSSTHINEDAKSKIFTQNSLAQSTLLSLKQKITMLEHLPLKTNGMPRTQ